MDKTKNRILLLALTAAALGAGHAGENGFSRYRFKVDKVGPAPWGQVEYMQLSELRLYDGHETDVTDRHIRLYSGSRAAVAHDPFRHAVDGVISGAGKWVDKAPALGDMSNLWLRIDFPEPVKVMSYAWWTGNDAISKTHWRDPVSWRMQGSDDGRTWVDLDVRTDYDVPTNRNCRVGPFGCPPPAARPVDAVDPWMGTGADLKDRQGYGGMSHPGARVPFGMTQVVADRSCRDSSNYMFPDATAEGISCTRLNGVGYYGDFGNFLVRPTVDFRDTFLDRAVSTFSHRGETAAPGRYGVFLDRFGVDVQTAATAHGAILSFVYPATDKADLCIDLARRIGTVNSWSRYSAQSARVVGRNALEGEMFYSCKDGGWGHGEGQASYRMYFHAEFSQPLADVLFYDGNRPFPGANAYAGSNVVFTARFPSNGTDPIALKVAFSYTDLEGARRNFAADFPKSGFDVAPVADAAREAWRRALDVMTVEGGTPRDRAVFASCLFFALQDPRAVADVDGRYRAGDKVHQAKDFAYRTVFSGWDVFRSQIPLLSLVAPKHLSDTVNSLMATMEANKRDWLPVWDIFGCNSSCMLGNPAIPTILTAYAAGIRTFDAEKALRQCVSSQRVRGNSPCGWYWQWCELSNTLEYAYDDWCTGRLAELLGKPSGEFYDKSLWYTNCWSREVDWMRARRKDGSWMPWKGLTGEWQGTCESNPYQQGWFVPHDPEGFIRLCGGDARFAERLDEFMRLTPGNYVGNPYYNHSNEPVHLVPFLFHFAGRPDLTQKWTRRICANAYDIGSRGLCGAEDEGQMTGWYVLASAGLHPACPGSGVWIVTSPVFDKVTIRLDPNYYKGGTFTVRAVGNSERNVYVRRAWLNGREIDRLWLRHEEIAAGGELRLEMGAEPPKRNWVRPPNPLERKPTEIRVSSVAELVAVPAKVAALSAATRAAGVTVTLAPGVYRLEQPLGIHAAASGSEGAPVVWRSADPKSPALISRGLALPADALRPVTDAALRSRLPVAVRDAVRMADLSRLPLAWPGATVGEVYPPFAMPEIYADGQPLHLATFPRTGWALMTGIPDPGTTLKDDQMLPQALAAGDVKLEDVRGGTFTYKEDAPSAWKVSPGLFVQAYWCFDWRDTIIPVKALDPAKKAITMTYPHMYGIRLGNPSPRRWRALNVLEEIREPGDYALDQATKTLYVLPPRKGACYSVCGSSSPVVDVSDAHDTVLRDLAFGESFGDGVWGLRCRRVALEGCRFRNQRCCAISLSGAYDSRISRCDVSETGSGGVYLNGGVRRTLEPGRNVIEDCRITRFSTRRPCYSPAITLSGVANVARHNELSDAPHMAVGIDGNNHIFEYNVVSNVCHSSDDASAVYKGRNPSCRGNVIRWNRFIDIGAPMGHGTAAVYFDDGDGGDTVYGCEFVRCGSKTDCGFGAVFINGGYGNRVENCVFRDCERALGHGEWGDDMWLRMIKGLWQQRLLKEVDIRKPPYSTAYPELKGFMDLQPRSVRTNYSQNNVVIGCHHVLYGRWVTNETTVAYGKDPGPSVISARLPKFKPIPIGEIGIRQNRP